LYASASLKDQVLKYVTATITSGDDRVDQGSRTVTPSNPVTVEPQKMAYDTDYYLVAVGKHPSLKASDIKADDTIANHYGYKAVAIKKVDLTAPQLKSASPLALQDFRQVDGGPQYIGSKPVDSRPDWDEKPEDFKYSGYITLTYDKPLYYNDNGTLKTVVLKKELTAEQQKTMISASTLIGGSSASKVSIDTTNKSLTSPTQEFTFKVSNVSLGDLFIFPNSNKVVGSSSGDAAAMTELRFDPTLTSSSYKGGNGTGYLPGFILVTSSSNT
jgi:hypothetical protein